MAAPHVAGLISLLIDAVPGLEGDVGTLESLIRASAVPLTTAESCGGVPGSEIPNNTYGYGRIDAWEAYQLAITQQVYFPLVVRLEAVSRP